MGSTSTSWTVIEAAASGDEQQRRRFVTVYGPVVRAYLQARWTRPAMRQSVEDAAQEVFYDCFREGGALSRADRHRPNRFRAFLHGVTRRVAAAFEARWRKHAHPDLVGSADHESDERSLEEVFDRAWAQAILAEALDRLQRDARASGDGAVRRVELLRLRVHENRPIRDIAAAWEEAPARLHHEYARARKEFLSALKVTLGEHTEGVRAVRDEDVRELLNLLQ